MRKSRAHAMGYSLTVVIASVLTVYPFLFMVLSSLKNNEELFANYWGLPSVFRYDNFVQAWVDGKLSTYAFNSVFVTITATTAALLLATMLAYAFVQIRFRGSGLLFLLVLFTIFIPDEMNIVPRFLLLKELGLIGTRWNLILVYTVGSMATATYIIRNYMLSIPKELSEAAGIDGCGEWRVFFNIYIPLIVPVLLSVVIFIINGIWGEYTWALVSVSDDKLRTLPVGLTVFQSLHGANYGPLMAGLCMMTIPVILLFAIFTKQFMAGFTQGAVKE